MMWKYNLLLFNEPTGYHEPIYIDDSVEITAEGLALKHIISPTVLVTAEDGMGSYLPCPPKLGGIDFVVNYNNLADGKTITVKAYQAYNVNGVREEEIVKYRTDVTASNGEKSGIITVCILNIDVTKGYVKIDVSTDGTGVMVDAVALIRKQYLY